MSSMKALLFDYADADAQICRTGVFDIAVPENEFPSIRTTQWFTTSWLRVIPLCGTGLAVCVAGSRASAGNSFATAIIISYQIARDR
jgi:hypothetical protein